MLDSSSKKYDTDKYWTPQSAKSGLKVCLIFFILLIHVI